MREMKDSGIDYIGYIPTCWSVLRNKNVFLYSKDIVGDKSSSTQLLSLTTKGIKEKDINNAEGKLPESFDTYQFVKINDLVMCLFDLDVSAVFSGISSFEGMISPAYKVLSCNENMNPIYADYWFQYISHDRKFNHYAKNIRCTLNIDEFQALPMLVPPINEQKRIADYLDRKCSKIDSIIAKQEHIIEKLKEYKISIISEAIAKGIDSNVEMKDTGNKWFGRIPKHYSICRLKNNCEKVADGTHFSPEIVDDGYSYITASDVKGRGIDYSQTKRISKMDYDQLVKQGCRPEKNDVLIVKDGATTGRVGLMIDEEECVILSSVAMLHPIKEVSSEWLMYLMMSDCMQKQILQSMAGSAMPRTTLNKLNEYDSVYVPLDEQERIVNYLNNRIPLLECIIEKKQQLIRGMVEYKKSLIYEVVTGKKEV